MKNRVLLNIGKIEGAADMLDLRSDSESKDLSLFLRRISTELVMDLFPVEEKPLENGVHKAGNTVIIRAPMVTIPDPIKVTPANPPPIDSENERPCARANCPDKGKLFKVRSMTKSKFGLFCTKQCYKTEYARLYAL